MPHSLAFVIWAESANLAVLGLLGQAISSALAQVAIKQPKAIDYKLGEATLFKAKQVLILADLDLQNCVADGFTTRHIIIYV